VSLKVLAVPEDPTYNGYILRPLLERIFQECGKPNVFVKVLDNPRVQGYENAKDLLIRQILERYRPFDLILFLPDADGRDRSAEFVRLEDEGQRKGVKLICCAAVQEVEVWLLSGHADKLTQDWSKIRDDPRIKETVFEPFLRQHGDPRRVGGGRGELMSEALRNYRGMKDRCPELRQLEDRIRGAIEGRD
jgi:hypothetical protein